MRRVLTSNDRTNDVRTRADDYYNHGTFVTGIAAGLTTGDAGVRDDHGYSKTQGVASNGTKVAMAKMLPDGCTSPADLRQVSQAEPRFTFFAPDQMLRYALVALSREPSDPALPDSVVGAGARIFNHSYQGETTDYDPSAVLIDLSAGLSTADFDFGTLTSPNRISGAAAGALHVIAAGNVGQGPVNSLITSPGTAKNGLTVGATESYNPLFGAACSDMQPEDADLTRQFAWGFSRYGYPFNRLKPDLVAPGVKIYGRESPESRLFNPNYLYCQEGCYAEAGGIASGVWRGTSFSTPIVTGAATLVREWLRTKPLAEPSPALVKATLIAAARNLVEHREVWGTCCEGSDCWPCGDMRPTPDQYQGWGGVALDRLFRDFSHNYFNNQTYVLTTGQSFSKYLDIVDSGSPINMALVWTDRAADATGAALAYVANDLDFRAEITGTDGVTHRWYGNNYYYDRDAVGAARTGFSLRDPSPITYDRKNNVERININPAVIPSGATRVKVVVTSFSTPQDGVDPWSAFQRQDFALAVENAH